MRRHYVAAGAIDTMAVEVYPCVDGNVLFPVHLLQLRDMGLTQGQNFALEELSAHCAADGTYEMLLVAQPAPVTGCTGAPSSPVAAQYRWAVPSSPRRRCSPRPTAGTRPPSPGSAARGGGRECDRRG